MLDESEIYVKELSNTIINLYKLCIEEMGYDMGFTNNEIEYRNYLVNDPISISVINSGQETPEQAEEESIISQEDIQEEPTQGGKLQEGIQKLEGGGMIYGGVYIPQKIIDTQTFNRQCPKDLLDGVKRASKITGIPVKFYIIYAALESSWNKNAGNKVYGGYFAQRAGEGRYGDAFTQAQGSIVSIYNNAVKTAQSYGFDKNAEDLVAWCYLCHNAGTAGAKTMLQALNGNLRHSSLADYKNAAVAWMDKHFPKISGQQREKMIMEKTVSIPKAYYLAYQINNKNIA